MSQDISEFDLIAAIVDELGAQATADWVRIGPGDDASVVRVAGEREWVSSIDTLLADVHFPVTAPAALVGYRALMVSLSDLAAMAATPRYVLVALTLPQPDVAWLRLLARGMAEAAAQCQVAVCGGNLTRGPLSITVSVHGDCAPHSAVSRADAQIGDQLWVSGELGGAAACVRQSLFDVDPLTLTPIQHKYYKPRARLDLALALQNHASAAIDISDGLLQDLGHLAQASNVGLRINSTLLPVCAGATLQDALSGGDDYELICAASTAPPGFVSIGEVIAGDVVLLDDQAVVSRGFDHFAAAADDER